MEKNEQRNLLLAGLSSPSKKERLTAWSIVISHEIIPGYTPVFSIAEIDFTKNPEFRKKEMYNLLCFIARTKNNIAPERYQIYFDLLKNETNTELAVNTLLEMISLRCPEHTQKTALKTLKQKLDTTSESYLFHIIKKFNDNPCEELVNLAIAETQKGIENGDEIANFLPWTNLPRTFQEQLLKAIIEIGKIKFSPEKEDYSNRLLALGVSATYQSEGPNVLMEPLIKFWVKRKHFKTLFELIAQPVGYYNDKHVAHQLVSVFLNNVDCNDITEKMAISLCHYIEYISHNNIDDISQNTVIDLYQLFFEKSKNCPTCCKVLHNFLVKYLDKYQYDEDLSELFAIINQLIDENGYNSYNGSFTYALKWYSQNDRLTGATNLLQTIFSQIDSITLILQHLIEQEDSALCKQMWNALPLIDVEIKDFPDELMLEFLYITHFSAELQFQKENIIHLVSKIFAKDKDFTPQEEKMIGFLFFWAQAAQIMTSSKVKPDKYQNLVDKAEPEYQKFWSLKRFLCAKALE